MQNPQVTYNLLLLLFRELLMAKKIRYGIFLEVF